MRIERHPQDHENTWRFGRDELKAIMRIASQDLARVHIATLCLDATHRAAVVTDGHRMVAMTPGDSVDPEAGIRSIPRAPLDVALKVASRKHDTISIRPNCTTARVVVERNGAHIYDHKVDLPGDTYPQWQQVIHSGYRKAGDTPPDAVGLDASYLADLASFAPLIDSVCPRGTLRLGKTALDPITYEAETTDVDDGTSFKYVVMPVKL